MVTLKAVSENVSKRERLKSAREPQKKAYFLPPTNFRHFQARHTPIFTNDMMKEKEMKQTCSTKKIKGKINTSSDFESHLH